MSTSYQLSNMLHAMAVFQHTSPPVLVPESSWNIGEVVNGGPGITRIAFPSDLLLPADYGPYDATSYTDLVSQVHVLTQQLEPAAAALGANILGVSAVSISRTLPLPVCPRYLFYTLRGNAGVQPPVLMAALFFRSLPSGQFP